jgi:hypothetical protein
MAAAAQMQSNSLPERFRRRLEESAKRRAAADAAAREAAMEQQKNNAQLKRDKLQQQFEQANTAQRANISSGLAAQDNQYATQRDQSQYKRMMARDESQQRYMTQRDRQQALEQQQRDELLQGFTRQNMAQRETADVAARWNEQVMQARNAGLDFSPRQQQEMKQLDATFRKNVLNGNLTEDLKQQAMLLHQKQLSAIIPEDKVQKPEDQLKQSLHFDERLPGVPFLMGRDSQGNPTFEPLPLGGGSTGGKRQADPEQQAAERRKMVLEREKALQKLHREITQEVDSEANPIKRSPQEIDNEVMKRFAADEVFYVESGLPPHELYQLKAKQDQQKQQEQQQPQTQVNPWRQKLSGQQSPSGLPEMPKPKMPVSVTTSDIDARVSEMETGGDAESAAALRAIKEIAAKHGGSPPSGSEDKMIFDEAAAFLRAKGVSLQTNIKPPIRQRPDVNVPHPGKL